MFYIVRMKRKIGLRGPGPYVIDQYATDQSSESLAVAKQYAKSRALYDAFGIYESNDPYNHFKRRVTIVKPREENPQGKLNKYRVTIQVDAPDARSARALVARSAPARNPYPDWSRRDEPIVLAYHVRFIQPSQATELMNLYHLARVPLSGTGRDTPYERMLWASNEFHKLHPEISCLAAYKDLDGIRSNYFR